MTSSARVKDLHLGVFATCLRYVSWLMVKTVQRPKRFSGALPALDQPTIFVCRHVGLIDPIIMMVAYFRKVIRPLVARDYYDKSPATRFFYREALCIPIERRNPSTEWIDRSLEALSKGESVLIFPEGKRNKTGKGLLPFHNGAALLAARSGCRIIPVYNAFWTFPHRYRYAVGKPMHLDPPPQEGITAEYLRAQTARIRAAVEELGVFDK